MIKRIATWNDLKDAPQSRKNAIVKIVPSQLLNVVWTLEVEGAESDIYSTEYETFHGDGIALESLWMNGIQMTAASVVDDMIFSPANLYFCNQNIETLDGCEIENWSTLLAALPEILNNVDQIEGTGCLDLGKNATSAAAYYQRNNTLTPFDVTDKNVFMGLYIIDAAALAKFAAAIGVRMYVGEVPWSKYRRLDFDPANFVVGWQRLGGNTDDWSDTGSPDLTALDSLRLDIRSILAADQWASGDIKMDWWRIVDPSATGKLWINVGHGDNPYDNQYVAKHLMYFSNDVKLRTAIEIGDNEIVPEPQIDSVPTIKRTNNGAPWGLTLPAKANLKLNNLRGNLDQWYRDLEWQAAPVDVYLGGEDLPFSEYQLLYAGRIVNDLKWARESLTMALEDKRYKLFKGDERRAIGDNNDVAVLDNCEIANWDIAAGAINETLNPDNHRQGTYSLNLGLTASPGNYSKAIDSVDASENTVARMWFNQVLLSTVDSVEIRIGSDAANYYWMLFEDSVDLLAGWNVLGGDLLIDYSVTGSPDLSDITYLYINITAPGAVALGDIFMDYWRLGGERYLFGIDKLWQGKARPQFYGRRADRLPLIHQNRSYTLGAAMDDSQEFAILSVGDGDVGDMPTSGVAFIESEFIRFLAVEPFSGLVGPITRGFDNTIAAPHAAGTPVTTLISWIGSVTWNVFDPVDNVPQGPAGIKNVYFDDILHTSAGIFIFPTLNVFFKNAINVIGQLLEDGEVLTADVANENGDSYGSMIRNFLNDIGIEDSELNLTSFTDIDALFTNSTPGMFFDWDSDGQKIIDVLLASSQTWLVMNGDGLLELRHFSPAINPDELTTLEAHEVQGWNPRYDSKRIRSKVRVFWERKWALDGEKGWNVKNLNNIFDGIVPVQEKVFKLDTAEYNEAYASELADHLAAISLFKQERTSISVLPLKFAESQPGDRLAIGLDRPWDNVSQIVEIESVEIKIAKGGVDIALGVHDVYGLQDKCGALAPGFNEFTLVDNCETAIITLDDCENAIYGRTNAPVETLDTVNFKEGTSSLNIGKDGGGLFGFYEKTVIDVFGAPNLTGLSGGLWLYVTDKTDFVNIIVKIGNDILNYYHLTFASALFTDLATDNDPWNDIVSMSGGIITTWNVVNVPNILAIDWIQIGIETALGADTVAIGRLKMDWWQASGSVILVNQGLYWHRANAPEETLDTVNFIEGAASLNLGKNGGGVDGSYFIFFPLLTAPVDLTDLWGGMYLYVEDKTDFVSITLKIGTDAANYFSKTFTASSLTDQTADSIAWNNMAELSGEELADWAQTLAPDIAVIKYLSIVITTALAVDTIAIGRLKMDYWLGTDAPLPDWIDATEAQRTQYCYLSDDNGFIVPGDVTTLNRKVLY